MQYYVFVSLTVMVCITSKTIIIVGQFCAFRAHAAGCDYFQYVSRADAAGRNYFESYRVNYTNKHYTYVVCLAPVPMTFVRLN